MCGVSYLRNFIVLDCHECEGEFYEECRGGRTTDAKGWLKRGGGSRAPVGSRGEVGMSERGTQDIPRFGALRRDNTPSPAECGLYVIVRGCSQSCTEEEGRLAKA